MVSEKFRLLIVDDESIIRECLMVFFEDEGYEVVAAEDGSSALQAIAAERPRVGIIDMSLPDMQGNELVCKAFEINPEMKFIIHTGLLDYSLPEELLHIGLTDDCVFYKPVSDMGSLEKAVRCLIEDQ